MALERGSQKELSSWFHDFRQITNEFGVVDYVLYVLSADYLIEEPELTYVVLELPQVQSHERDIAQP
jgi:hypothetical protein